MTISERNNKLKHFITCLKCKVSGKCCNDNCSTQYDAGNMGEIIENLEAISKTLEQEPTTKNDLGVDLISRQAVLEQAYAYGNGLEPDGYCVNVEDIQALPSVTPQEPIDYKAQYESFKKKAEIVISQLRADRDRLMSLLSETPQEPKWILTTEQLPKDRDWYLGIFKEPDTGWINPLPFICDYVGRKTKATTKEYWILRGFTDIDEPCDYYLNLECVAWMPLPQPYKGVEE